jgi:hypothetical protein
MRRFILILLLISVTGCSIPLPDPKVVFGPKELPQANIPGKCRQWNWSQGRNGGSCVHATCIMLFRWAGQPTLAAWWRNNHGGGEAPHRLASKLDRAGIPYAMTFKEGDIEFLEWACNTRRGCGVGIYGRAHMVVLVGLTDKWAILLDPNAITQFTYIPRETFINEWLWSDSWAVAFCLPPCPPKTVL